MSEARSSPRPNGIVTLLTDFGMQDAYVACMKGVILGLAPHARLVDITHEVAPQAIGEAAYLLRSTHHYFPPGTVHVSVVDPGVGGERRAIAVATPEAYFVAPDNGLLAPIVEEAREVHGDEVSLIELTEPRYWRSEISTTFHGRDIFAPVAAHLLNGVGLGELGRPLAAIARGTMQPVGVGLDGTIRGAIVHVDRFGNCITNIAGTNLPRGPVLAHLVVEIAGQRIEGLYRTYSDGPVGTPMALVGSSGFLELAVRNGNAARWLGVVAGDRLIVRTGGTTA